MKTTEQQAVTVAHFFPDAALQLGKLLAGSNVVADDARALVIAAREFWDPRDDGSPESRALLSALEAFSSRVPYEDEPASLHCKSGEGAGCKTCGGRRSINYAESTCQPAHQGPCPSCVGVTIAKFPVTLTPDATQTREAEGLRELVMDAAERNWNHGPDALTDAIVAALNARGGA